MRQSRAATQTNQFGAALLSDKRHSLDSRRTPSPPAPHSLSSKFRDVPVDWQDFSTRGTVFHCAPRTRTALLSSLRYRTEGVTTAAPHNRGQVDYRRVIGCVLGGRWTASRSKQALLREHHVKGTMQKKACLHCRVLRLQARPEIEVESIDGCGQGLGSGVCAQSTEGRAERAERIGGGAGGEGQQGSTFASCCRCIYKL